MRLLRPKRRDPNFFTVEDMQRWALNRRLPPQIPLQTATTAFSMAMEHATVLNIQVECSLGRNCKGKYCKAVHRINRRSFLRVRYDAFRSVKRGGPIIAGTLYRYQQYLRHGGGRKVA